MSNPQSYTYNDRLNDIRYLLTDMDKQAADNHIQDTKQDVLDGDIRNKVGPGVTAPKSQEKNEGISGKPNPLQEDNNDAVNYELDASKKQNDVNQTMKAAEQDLLATLYGALYSKEAAEGEEDVESEEAAEVVEEPKDETEEEMSAEDVALTPEEEAALKEEGAGEEEKKAYLQTKQAGYNYAKHLTESGALEKIACAIYGPQIDEIADFKAGQAIYDLEKAGMFPNEEQISNAVQVLAGAQIAELEKAGSIKIIDPKLKAALNGEQPVEKKASLEKTAEENFGIIKAASERSANRVLDDLFKMGSGSQLNEKLEKIANPH